MGVLSAYSIKLTVAQRTLYDRLRAQGIQDDIARQLAVAIEKGAKPATVTYHQAFVDEAKKYLAPHIISSIHQTAKARSGGVASGLARREAREGTIATEPVMKGQKPLGAAFSHAKATGKNQSKKARKRRANAYLKREGHEPIGKSDTHVPPSGVQAACKRGLSLASEYGGPGLTEGAKARARAMAAGRGVTIDQLKRMKSFFARHDSYAKSSNPPSPGYVAWLLWGGDAGKSWANARADSADVKKFCARLFKASDFNEEDHPRDEAGKFSDDGSGGGSSASAGKSDSPSVEPRGTDRHATSFHRQSVQQHLRERDKSQAKADKYRAAGKEALAAKHQANADAHKNELKAIRDDKTEISDSRYHELDSAAREAYTKGGSAGLESHFSSLRPAERAFLAGVDRHIARQERSEDRRAVTKALGVMRFLKGMSPLPSEFSSPTYAKAPKRRKKKKKAGAGEIDFKLKTAIIKAKDDWQRLVYSVVYAPDTVDFHGDGMSAQTIEKAAHDAMQSGIYINNEHEADALGAHVVESYIAPCDMNIEGDNGRSCQVRKGTWVMGLKVTDDTAWQRVVDGTYKGFSLEGTGIAEMLAA